METQEKTNDLFAYVSTAEANQQDRQPNALHGKLRKCNLTKSRLAGGVTLAEVHLDTYMMSTYFTCKHSECISR